jgi:nucleoside-diphosphate-sugar epimerase
MRVLVTGGRDVLGRELARRLGNRSEVRVLSRRPPRRLKFVRGLQVGERVVGRVVAGGQSRYGHGGQRAQREAQLVSHAQLPAAWLERQPHLAPYCDGMPR